MTRTTALLLVVFGIACGATRAATSASATSTGGAGSPPHDAGSGGSDAGVAPNACTDAGVPMDGAVLIPEGWFLMSRWTTAVELSAMPPIVAEPTQRVFLNAFRIDVHEVTTANFYAFVQATGAAPIPDVSGDVSSLVAGDAESGLAPQTCGWSSGVALPSFYDNPVVCTTRREAAAYCAWKGGRLPTVAEWLKAGRGSEPDARRFPWGDSPPMDVAPDEFNFKRPQLLAVLTPLGPGLQTGAVGSDYAGASPRCVLGLAGNATEMLSTCQEDIPMLYPAGMDLMTPMDPQKADCGTAVLMGGTHWRWLAGDPMGGTQLVYRMRGVAPPAYEGAPESASFPYPPLWTDMWAQNISGGDSGNSSLDPAGNDRRDWRIGFRCAYDVK